MLLLWTMCGWERKKEKEKEKEKEKKTRKRIKYMELIGTRFDT